MGDHHHHHLRRRSGRPCRTSSPDRSTRCTSPGTARSQWIDFFGSYVIPAVIGNILGGVSLVAAINHAQVVAGKTGADV